MAICITFGLQKGGCSKTTVSSIFSYLLSKQGKVLSIDMDSQSSLTELLAGVDDLEVFRERTVLEAMKKGNGEPYIVPIAENWGLLPSDDFLATMDRVKFDNNPSTVLKIALQSVSNDYDYICIDTPPALSIQTINALSAADYVVIPFETSKFSYRAIRNFLGTCEVVQERTNSKLKIAGILRTMLDGRRKDSKFFVEAVKEKYKEYCPIFDTIITRSAHIGRLPLMGFFNNVELNKIERDFEPAVKELIDFVEQTNQ